jgi:hypothetical protein
VTDHGSAVTPVYGKISAPQWVIAKFQRIEKRIRCCFCGRPGQYIKTRE